MRRSIVVASVVVVLAAVTPMTVHATSGAAAEASSHPARASATADARALVSPLDQFGLRLLSRQLQGSAGNVVISPLSVHDVLSAILNGAQGQTEAQTRAVLGLGTSPLLTVDRGWAGLLAAVQAGKKPTVTVANSLWLKDGVRFAPAFVAADRDHFGAATRALPADPAAAAAAINAWTAQHTAGLIKKIVDPSSFNPATILALVNTVHLKAPWQEPFDKGMTAPAAFTAADGRTVQVPTMNGSLTAPLARTLAYDAVGLRTKGTATVWVVVPKGSETPGSLVAGFAAAVKGAAAGEGVGQARGGAQATGGLAGLYAAAEPQPVLLALPRFKLEYTVPDLKADLSAMGMPRAFSPDDAELMGIVAPGTGGNVFIQQVVHKAVLDVNEAGVEAAAATGAIVGVTSVPVGRVTVRADRPFLVLITDESTHAPLFMAVVRTPRS